MEVRACMSRNVIQVRPEDTVNHAIEAMREHHIRHLPVRKGEKLVGVVSERDTRRFQSLALEVRGNGVPLIISQIMNPHVITIDPGAAVHEAAALMVKHRIGALPVVENGETVGIISDTDILKLVAEAGEY